MEHSGKAAPHWLTDDLTTTVPLTVGQPILYVVVGPSPPAFVQIALILDRRSRINWVPAAVVPSR